MTEAFARLPAPRPETKLTVAIPARDEARTLAATLAALTTQIDDRGRPLAPRSFEIVVFANDCRDATPLVARAFAREHPSLDIYVVEDRLPSDAAHVGTARGELMDAAAERFLRTRRPLGIVASTDADSVVDARWVAGTFAEMTRADAVTGRIALAPADLAALPGRVRAAFLIEDAYRGLVAELEAIRDPVGHDPLPRHGNHVGASFAVTSEAYRRAGGLPRLARMEDIGLYAALHRIDARVRHSPYVRVTTAARTVARVEGGFATRLRGYANGDDESNSQFVEVPTFTLARIDGRAALRRIWNGMCRTGDLERVTRGYGISIERFWRLFDHNETFGVNAERLEREGADVLNHPPLVPIRFAYESLSRVRSTAEGTAMPMTAADAPALPARLSH